MFATVILTTYASVFILLSLLLIQFTPLTGGAAPRGPHSTSLVFFALVAALGGAAAGALTAPVTAPWLALSLLWQDLAPLAGASGCAVFLVHELLYRLFIWEVVWANVFLALAFVVYATLLKVRAARVPGGAYAAVSSLFASRAWRVR